MGFRIAGFLLAAVLLVALASIIQFSLCSRTKRWTFKLLPLFFPPAAFFIGISVYQPVSPYGCGMGQLFWMILLGIICALLLLGAGLGWLIAWWRREE